MAKNLGDSYFMPNGKGIRAMMKSKEMQSLMFEYAQREADFINSNGDFGSFEARPVGEPVTGIVSAHAFVVTADWHARHSEAEYGVLQRIFGRG